MAVENLHYGTNFTTQIQNIGNPLTFDWAFFYLLNIVARVIGNPCWFQISLGGVLVKISDVQANCGKYIPR